MIRLQIKFKNKFIKMENNQRICIMICKKKLIDIHKIILIWSIKEINSEKELLTQTINTKPYLLKEYNKSNTNNNKKNNNKDNNINKEFKIYKNKDKKIKKKENKSFKDTNNNIEKNFGPLWQDLIISHNKKMNKINHKDLNNNLNLKSNLKTHNKVNKNPTVKHK